MTNGEIPAERQRRFLQNNKRAFVMLKASLHSENTIFVMLKPWYGAAKASLKAFLREIPSE
jgi:hypothetical protein